MTLDEALVAPDGRCHLIVCGFQGWFPRHDVAEGAPGEPGTWHRPDR